MAQPGPHPGILAHTVQAKTLVLRPWGLLTSPPGCRRREAHSARDDGEAWGLSGLSGAPWTLALAPLGPNPPVSGARTPLVHQLTLRN